jgi:hypothetical protein
MKKIALILSMLALSFTACKETGSVEPSTPARVSSTSNMLKVDLLIHSGKAAQFHYSYAEDEGTVKSGEPQTLQVLPGTKITLSADGASFYLNGEKLESNTFTVTSSCGVTAVFSSN